MFGLYAIQCRQSSTFFLFFFWGGYITLYNLPFKV
jgi:hypothetical protein